MKAHVWFSPDGVILTVGSAQNHASVTPISDTEGVKVIEVEVSSEAKLARLHETYRVDVGTEQLVAR